MSDYPDFANYKIPRFGDWKFEYNAHSVGPGGYYEFLNITGPAIIYGLRGWINGQTGQMLNRVRLYVDGVEWYMPNFAEFAGYGFKNDQNHWAYMDSYDLVNGDFGITFQPGLTFESSLVAQIWDTATTGPFTWFWMVTYALLT